MNAILKKFSQKASVLALAFSLVLLLTSCLEVKTELRLNTNGSGILSLEYRVYEELLSFGQYDGIESQMTLPVNKYEFERLAELNEDLELKRYRSRLHDNGIRTIRADLGFEDPQALGDIFGHGFFYSVGRAGEQSDMTVPLAEGFNSLNAEQANVLNIFQALVQEAHSTGDKDSGQAEDELVFLLSFQIDVPAGATYMFNGTAPQNLGQSASSNRIRLNFAYTLDDLLQAEGAKNITIRW